MKVFITGGAGFIGCNCVKYFMDQGHEVVALDNLSRPGSQLNLEWLRAFGKFQFIQGDIRHFEVLENYFKENSDVKAVLHLAAQTAVTTSILNPVEDFEINARGTLNVLEAVRRSESDPVVIYASTNKVYGSLEYLAVTPYAGYYEWTNVARGISEDVQIDFHTPYGCSKGVADQYVRDYHRIYGMKTAVFRQSCIYGPRQFGVEDQGWVAWFVISALSGNPVAIYGDGKQVRDILYVDDLISAYEKAIQKIDVSNGRIYNIGGGPDNRMSLLQLVELLEREHGLSLKYDFQPWRDGDQKIFLSDNTRLQEELGWRPTASFRQGISNLIKWVKCNSALFEIVCREGALADAEQGSEPRAWLGPKGEHAAGLHGTSRLAVE